MCSDNIHEMKCLQLVGIKTEITDGDKQKLLVVIKAHGAICCEIKTTKRQVEKTV